MSKTAAEPQSGAHADDAAQLAELGFESRFERRMGLWENFALGFTYLSPVVGVYSTFAIAFMAGGPPKKAVVEKLKAAHGVSELPESGPTHAIDVVVVNDRATLTLDSSGAGLSQRGYLEPEGRTLLRPTLAAGLVLLSVWSGERRSSTRFAAVAALCWKRRWSA